MSRVIDERVCGLHVLMDEALPVDLPKSRRQSDRNGQQARQILQLVLLDDPIQGFTSWILEYQERVPLVTSQRHRLSGPCRIEFVCQREFVFEPLETLMRGLLLSNRHHQDRHRVAALCAAVKSEVRPLAKRVQQVRGILCG